LEKKLISGKMIEKMLSPQVDEKCYGYGIWIKENVKGTYS